MEKNQNNLFNAEEVETTSTEATETTNAEEVETTSTEATETTNAEEVETASTEATETINAEEVEEVETASTLTSNQQDLFGLLGLGKKPLKKEVENKISKTTSKSKTISKNNKKEAEFKGTRIVRVYGTELFREENSSVTLEQLRQRIEEEFGFPEFTKDVTVMTLDKTTGIVVPVRKFGSKG